MRSQFWIGILVSIFIGVSAMASVSRSSERNPTSWVPYPWAKGLPFTWSTAQGVWTVGLGSASASSYFYIRVTTDKNNKSIKFLAITEKDAATCATVATGFGTEEDNTRIVAEMKYLDQARSRYRMWLQLYDPKEVPKGQGVQPFKGKVMVLSIQPHQSTKKYIYPMIKLSDRTEYPCTPTK